MSHAVFLLNVSVAVIGGVAIGFERQWRQRRAGLRTNALVAAGAALFATLGGFFGDPATQGRVAAQIVSGIGLNGGGIILREGFNVKGLNTAATLWCTAAVGALAGCGYPLEALFGAAVVVFVNVLLRPLASRINREPAENTEVEMQYTLRVSCRRRNEGPLRLALVQAIANEALVLQSLRHEELAPDRVELKAVVHSVGAANTTLEKIVNRLGVSAPALAVSWELVKADGEQVSAPSAPPVLEPAPA